MQTAYIMKYICINCRTPSDSLYRRYAPTVLKITKCDNCGHAVDKYIEQDLVVVMVNLVLVSQEAQRHIICNTPFKSHWKLLIVMMMIETYGIWSKGNIINVVLDNYCFTEQRVIPLNKEFMTSILFDTCNVWLKETNFKDPFVSELSFYIALTSEILGTISCILMLNLCVRQLQKRTNGCAKNFFVKLMKTVSLAYTSNIFTLPIVIWGSSDYRSRSVNFYLATAYGYYTFYALLRAIFGIKRSATAAIVFFAFILKYFVISISKTVIESKCT